MIKQTDDVMTIYTSEFLASLLVVEASEKLMKALEDERILRDSTYKAVTELDKAFNRYADTREMVSAQFAIAPSMHKRFNTDYVEFVRLRGYHSKLPGQLAEYASQHDYMLSRWQTKDKSGNKAITWAVHEPPRICRCNYQTGVVTKFTMTGVEYRSRRNMTRADAGMIKMMEELRRHVESQESV